MKSEMTFKFGEDDEFKISFESKRIDAMTDNNRIETRNELLRMFVLMFGAATNGHERVNGGNHE